MSEIPHFDILTFKKEAYIVVEGKESDCFFVIQDGMIQLSRAGEVVKELDGSTLGPGEFFGVVAAMSAHNHIETAQAITDVTVMAVQRHQFDIFIQHDIAMALNIIMQFSARIRYLTKSLTELTLNEDCEEEDTADLFNVGKYYENMESFSNAHYAYQQYLKCYPEGEYAAEVKERLQQLSSHAALVPFITEGNKRIYAKDTILYAQGEPGEELYVIQSGSVKITKIVNNSELLFSVLKTGDVIGELAILESKPRSVTAVINEDCTLIAVSKKNFTSIAQSHPQIIGRLIQSAAERIWFLYKQLANTLFIDPVARIYDALVIQLEKNRIPLTSKEAYTFNFGVKELIAFVGISEQESDKALQRIIEDHHIKIIEDRIHIGQVAEITKEGDYYKSIEWRKRAFRESVKNH